MNEKIYSEIGLNYRFFLGWRHAAFAGNLVVIYGAVSLTSAIYESHPALAWIILLLASPIGALLWVIDRRTRDLYHAAVKAGTELEGAVDGVYTKLDEVSLEPDESAFSRFTQTAALNVFFLGSSAVFLIAGLIVLYLSGG